MKKPLVSIIIVNWDGKALLKGCLSSLSKIDYKNKEIIVVDNGSKDGSIEFINQHYPKIKIIENKENFGFAKANNQGIKVARGSLVLFLNNDTRVEKDFLSILVEKIISDSKMGACQPKILHLEKPGRLDSIGSFLTNTGFLYHLGFEAKDTKDLDKEIKLFSGKGSCLLFRKKLLDQIGYFNEDFFAYFEETDLCWRLWLAGYYLLYIPQSVIHHKTWGTTRKLPLQFISYHSFKNRIASLLMNLEPKNLVRILPIHILICLFVALYYIVKLKPSNSLAILKATFWNVLNIEKILQKRKKVQSQIRKISDDSLFPVILKNASINYYYYILKYSFTRSKILGDRSLKLSSLFLAHFLPHHYSEAARIKGERIISYFEGKKVLDAGTGCGWLSRMALDKKYNVSSIDLSEKVIKLEKEFAKLSGFPKLKIQKASILKLPFRDESFDTVLCSEVLEHINPKNVSDALKEFHRVLKKEGVLIITVPGFLYGLIYDQILAKTIQKNKKTRFSYLGFLSTQLPKNINLKLVFEEEDLHKQQFSPTSMRTLLESSGFSLKVSQNLEILTPMIRSLSNLFAVTRDKFKIFERIDVSLSTYLPLFLGSDWLFVTRKK